MLTALGKAQLLSSTCLGLVFCLSTADKIWWDQTLGEGGLNGSCWFVLSFNHGAFNSSCRPCLRLVTGSHHLHNCWDIALLTQLEITGPLRLHSIENTCSHLVAL